MDITTLKLFVLAAKEKNFTKVAEEFHVTQPVVSRRMHELEEELKINLFERKNHGVALTNAASMLLPYIEKSIETLELGVTEVNKLFCQNKMHEISIVSMTPMISSFLPTIIHEFTDNLPDVTFDIQRMFSQEIRSNISNHGKGDIYICEESDISIGEDWQKAVIKSDPIMLMVSAHINLKSEDEISEFIRTHKPILLPTKEAAALSSRSRDILIEYKNDPSNWEEAFPVESIMFYVSSGMGFTLLPKNETFLQGYSLKQYDLGKTRILNMCICCKKNAPTYVKAFYEFVLKKFQE